MSSSKSPNRSVAGEPVVPISNDREPTVTQVELPLPVAGSGRVRALVRRRPWSPSAQLTEDARWSGMTASLHTNREPGARSREALWARSREALCQLRLAPMTSRPWAWAASARAPSCVAIVNSSRVSSFQRSAVAKWIASSVPSSVGIGCDARSRTTASISTSSREAISSRIVARLFATSGSPSLTRRRSRSSVRRLCCHHEGAGDASIDPLTSRAANRAAEDNSEQDGRINISNHRCPWRSSSRKSTMSTFSLDGFGRRTRLRGGAPGAGFRMRGAGRSRTGTICATSVSRSRTAIVSPRRTARRYSLSRLQFRDTLPAS
jgi:hypothetical protein